MEDVVYRIGYSAQFDDQYHSLDGITICDATFFLFIIGSLHLHHHERLAFHLQVAR